MLQAAGAGWDLLCHPVAALARDIVGCQVSAANAGLFLPSLLSLSPTSHVPTGPCTPSKGVPVHPPHHELEERPVVISQKFLIEAAEHLRRSKGRLSSVEIAVGASQLADTPRTPLHIQLGLPRRAGFRVGFTGVVLEPVKDAKGRPSPWDVHLARITRGIQ